MFISCYQCFPNEEAEQGGCVQHDWEELNLSMQHIKRLQQHENVCMDYRPISVLLH